MNLSLWFRIGLLVLAAGAPSLADSKASVAKSGASTPLAAAAPPAVTIPSATANPPAGPVPPPPPIVAPPLNIPTVVAPPDTVQKLQRPIAKSDSLPSARAKGMQASVDSLLKNDTTQTLEDEGGLDSDVESGSNTSKQGLAFAMKKPTRKEVVAFQGSILKAITALAKADYPKARKVLEKLEPTERLAQVYKTILLARAYRGEKQFILADSVLQNCLEWVGGSVWQSHLYNQRMEVFPQTQPSDSAKLLFYAKILQAPISSSVKVAFLYNQLLLQGFSGDPADHFELLKRLIKTAPSDRRLDSLYRTMAPKVPIGSGTWESQNLLLDLERKLGFNDSAIARSQAMVKMVPGKKEKQELHWNFANLHYRNKDYPNAIATYQKFIENYGETPDALLQIARCYDRLQEPKKAVIWYDRFLEKYPQQDKTSEIYWLRAWELEAQGDYVEAIEFYYRQLADFSANKRGDWANFRIGLCQIKAGNSAAALQAFRAIRSQVNSNAYPAGMFWEARSQEAGGDSAGARLVLQELAGKYPFNFYGHLARHTLDSAGALPDSLEPAHHFASSKTDGIKSWMKDGMSGFKENLENEFESEYLGMGKLLQFKLDTLAMLTMRTIPTKIKSNPWFLYVYARMFSNRHLWNESYRLGLQLSLKIPPDRWGYAPKEVLRLIFPRPYEGLVQKYSTKRGLDPAFVYALMRQESGFNREIKSGAGAVGLMQLMPATGQSVAKRLGMNDFDAFSLAEAEVNIQLGTAYLQELKKNFKNDYYFVLANYNAGPGPAKRWQASSRDKSLEMMIEDISYWETRDYVKRVMGNYWTYRSLWNNRVRTRLPASAH